MPLLYYSEKNDILINKNIENVIFSASKENRHYNMYGEKKPRLAVSRGWNSFILPRCRNTINVVPVISILDWLSFSIKIKIGIA